MNDMLLELGSNPFARSLIKQLGLPLPLPVKLRRDAQPWTARPLAGDVVLLGGEGGELREVLEVVIRDAGALLLPAASALGEERKASAVVFDATALRDAASLHALYGFFHPLMGRIASSGRALVLARAPDELEPEQAAAQGALEGFVRSLAKELGKVGATANLVRVRRGAESRVGPVARWLLSPKAAFVTAQPLVVSALARAVASPPLVRPLEGKVALVTGSARGIGAATAKLLATEGAKVLCLDRPQDAEVLEQVAQSIGGVAVKVDLAAPEAPQQISAAVRGAGGLDVLVHNAGITRDKTLARMKPEQWDQVLDVNLGAIVRVTAALEGQLRDDARVVCLSSVAGIAGNFGQTAYGASKSGVIGFVRASAERLARRGITVNAIAPGFIETRLTAEMPFAIREAARRMSALGQGGLPEDVGQAILFLATPGAHGLTGQVLRVCGGALVGA